MLLAIKEYYVIGNYSDNEQLKCSLRTGVFISGEKREEQNIQI